MEKKKIGKDKTYHTFKRTHNTESKVVSTEHQKAPQELDIPDLPTNLKNDMSLILQENLTSQWPALSINQVVYGNVY